MEKRRIESMAKRIAAEEEIEDEALQTIDRELDSILESIGVIGDNLDNIKTLTNEEKNTIEKIKGLFEEAINPYFADVLLEMEKLEGTE